MFKSQIRKYTIDLALDEDQRWLDVIEHERPTAKRLVAEAIKEAEVFLGPVPDVIRAAGAWLFGKAYNLSGGRYQGEIKAWSTSLNLSFGEVAALNCSYELVGGCTAGVRWIEGTGLVHVRSMDWPLAQIGNATRLFHFKNGGHEFYSVGITGFVGVISGMVPGAYSVTINWAPPVGLPTFDFGPAFLLREVLEQCDTYAEAVDVLRHTKLSASVFFMVTGTTKSQACVIERRRDSAAVRRMRKGVLVQANHHVAKKFRDNDDYWDCDVDDTWDRAKTLRDGLAKLGQRTSLLDAAKCLETSPVLNENTVQRMAFCPATGEIKVWRRKCR